MKCFLCRSKVMGLLITAVVLVVCWVGFVLLIQRRMLYPRGMLVAKPDAGQDVPGLVRIWVDSPQGRVEAWLLPADNARGGRPGPAVLFAHGNGELIDYWPDALWHYRRMGLAVMLCEYRGYGRSAGSPSEAAITDDFEQFYDWLSALPEVDARRIIFHGRSLGGAAVCALSQRRQPAAMILESAFTSVTDMARRIAVAPQLVLDKFDNRRILANFDRPVLILHGRADRIVPSGHAQRLHKVAKHSRLILYEGGHNDGLTQRHVYWNDIESFLRESSILPKSP